MSETQPGTTKFYGPTDSIQRFLAGEVVTRDQFVQDQSPWTTKVMDREGAARFGAMLERADR